MSLLRLLRTAGVTVTHEFRVDEVLTDAAGSVTATLSRLDGTVVAGPTTAGHPSTGTYTYPAPGQSQVDSLTLDWAGTFAGSAVTVRDYVEIVGGFLFDLAEARTAHDLDVVRFPAAVLASARIWVEQEAERICRQAFVPRFARESHNGTGNPQLGVQWPLIRKIRAVTVGGTAMSAPDVALLGYADHGVITRPGGAGWPAGTRNIIVEYEHGMDLPPEEVRQAGILRLRSALGQNTAGVPDRALSFSVADGGVYRLSTAAKQKTGFPDVDGVYERYTRQPRAVFA